MATSKILVLFALLFAISLFISSDVALARPEATGVTETKENDVKPDGWHGHKHHHYCHHPHCHEEEASSHKTDTETVDETSINHEEAVKADETTTQSTDHAEVDKHWKKKCKHYPHC